MKIVTGNLWNSTDNAIFITGNSYITCAERLVMGRGAALQLKNKVPDIDKVFGRLIIQKCASLGKYGLVWIEYENDHCYYGVFQVKYHFLHPADLNLIKYSCEELNKFVEISGMNVSVNYPGIGYGNRTEEEVLPIIKQLSDKVTVYKVGITA